MTSRPESRQALPTSFDFFHLQNTAKMEHRKYKRENLYTAVVIYKGPWGKTAAAKYRNIDADKPATWKRAAIFFKLKFPTATHVNLYGGISREFKRQEKLTDPGPEYVL